MMLRNSTKGPSVFPLETATGGLPSTHRDTQVLHNYRAGDISLMYGAVPATWFNLVSKLINMLSHNFEITTAAAAQEKKKKKLLK